MSRFQKARAEQAALKMAIYGPTGSGKTLTALLVAEGLAAHHGGRVAMIDTERGSDFFTVDVPERAVHPAGFDFDAVYSRSLAECLDACRETRFDEHPVVVIDSVTHLWEAARNAYTGRTNRAGQIPMHAWGQIKAPYKALMHWMLNTRQHVLLCGRQGNDWSEDDSGELVNAGYKMKAEGETAYEPHVLLRLEVVRPPSRGKAAKRDGVHVAHVEKDRSGKLPRLVEWPAYANLAAPLLSLLGQRQAAIEAEDDAAARDHDALERERRDRDKISSVRRDQLAQKLRAARHLKALNELVPEIEGCKGTLLTAHLDAVRGEFRACRERLLAAAADEPPAPPAAPMDNDIERDAIQSEPVQGEMTAAAQDGPYKERR